MSEGNLLIAFILLVSVHLYSQNEKITKRELLTAFKLSIEQKDKNRIDTDSNPWFTNNTDSLFYKADTVVLTNAISFKRDYCRVINWNFYESDHFILSDANYCNEPPIARVNRPEDWFRIKLVETKNGLFLETYNSNILTDKFKVISLSVNRNEFILTLNRLKK